MKRKKEENESSGIGQKRITHRIYVIFASGVPKNTRNIKLVR